MLALPATPRHARTTHRRRSALVLLAASTLAGLVLLLPAGASAAAPDCFAVNWQQPCRVSGGDAFTDTGLCAFPVNVTVFQTGEYEPVFAKDGSGQLLRETDHVLTSATIVNPATGRSFTDGGQTSDRATYLPDGSVELRRTGIWHNARVDTGQLLFHQAGYHSVLIGPDGQLLNDVFHGNFFESDSEFAAEVCPILAQPA